MAPPFNDIFGTEANEDLLGTSGDDRIYGYGGADRLYGKGGSDQLYGGAGNDLLDAETGSDAMFGGSGDDIYRVDDPEDFVSEETAAGVDDGGTDSVQSAITYALGAFLENLTLTGTAANDGTGNALANRITGNDAANTLAGGGGNDTLLGGAGDDRLIGGTGTDTLTGGIGADTFVCGPADAAGTDKVTDFATGDWLGIFAGDYGLSEGSGLVDDGTGKPVLDASYFATVSGPGNVQGTASGHGQFVYNTTTRALMWDADGAGTASSGIALATFNSGVVLSAAELAITTAPPPPFTAAVANGAPNAQAEGSPARIGFTVALSAVANEDVVLTYSTVDGTAVAGSDFVGVVDGQAIITPGNTSTTIWIDLLNDTLAENAESFTLRLDAAQLAASGTALTITDGAGTGNIADDDVVPPSVVAIHDMAAIGSSDPSGLAYDPTSGTLFLSDSEVDESPFLSPNNLFALGTDGTFIDSFNLTASFTDEPTGLAFDPATGRLLIGDDDQRKVFWVDPANPTVKLGEFATDPVGVPDPEDLAVDPSDGQVFFINPLLPGNPAPRSIVETTNAGALVSTIILPEVIIDPEALAYDASHDVFYVGGGFSWNIWVVDRSGAILEVIDILSDFRNPLGNIRVHVKDLEFAPSSDPNDDPGKLSLFVADFGNSHVNDGRLIEIDVGNPVPNAPPVGSPTISDATPTQGQALSATNSFTDADGLVNAVFTYQWQQSAVGGGGGFQDIAGATGQTFTPDPAQVDRQLQVAVSYTDDHGTAETVTSAATATVRVNAAPVGTVLISDETPTEGQGLTATNSFTDADGLVNAVFTYQWQQSAVGGGGGFQDIAGATGQTFTPDPAQVDRQLQVAVSYSDDHGTAETVTSAATATVRVNAAPVGTVLISDETPTEGQGLTATNSFTDADGLVGVTFTYQWQQSAVGGGGGFQDIAGATGQTFTPDPAQVNRQLQVVVSYTDNQGHSESVTSAATTVVGDLLAGDGNANTLTGTAGQDNISGNGGNDTITGLGENDTINGGAGTLDIATFTGTIGQYAINPIGGGQWQVVDSVAGRDGTDTLTNVERFQFADQVFNTNAAPTVALANRLASMPENPSLAARIKVADIAVTDDGVGVNRLSLSGAQAALFTIVGSALYLKAGANVDFETTPTVNVTVNVDDATVGATPDVSVNYSLNLTNVIERTGGDTVTTITGTAGTDILDGRGGNDTLSGLAGNDYLQGGTGRDTMTGGLGDDTFVVDIATDVVNEAAGGGTDAVVTTLSSYTLPANVENLRFAGTGNFTGTGNALDNEIQGGSGNDTLSGLGGNDTLIGLGGNDNLNGGANNDTFVFAPGFGQDTISGGFTAGAGVADVIEFNGIASLGSFADLAITQSGADVLITVDAANTITIQGATASAFVADDFRFV